MPLVTNLAEAIEALKARNIWVERERQGIWLVGGHRYTEAQVIGAARRGPLPCGLTYRRRRPTALQGGPDTADY